MFVKTKDSKIGGRLTPGGEHIIVATIEDGLTIVEKIEASMDDIDEVIEKGVSIFHEIKMRANQIK